MIKNTFWAVAGFGVALCLTGSTSANELRFSDLEQRLKVVERQLDERQGVRAAAYQDVEPAPIEGEVEVESDSHVVGGECCNDGYCSCCPPSCGHYYGEAQVVWIRPHVNEDWVGKLSEEHELSTRYILGYEDCSGLGARVRYWHFDHSINVLDPARLGMRVQTFDIEATNRVCFRSTDVVLGGGFRYAGWELGDDNGDDVELDAIGLTMAADARTPLHANCGSQLSFVYGGRLSLLGGNWSGDNDIIDTIGPNEVRDDNIFVTELFSGFEYMFNYSGYDMFARVVAEMQNWRSDVLAEPGIGNGIAPLSIGSTNSIGFVGLGVHVGAAF